MNTINMNDFNDLSSYTEESIETVKIQTFRYKFSQEFTKQISYFAKIHQYNDRQVFKESWLEWIKQDEIIDKLQLINSSTTSWEKSLLFNRNISENSLNLYNSSKKTPLLFFNRISALKADPVSSGSFNFVDVNSNSLFIKSNSSGS